MNRFTLVLALLIWFPPMCGKRPTEPEPPPPVEEPAPTPEPDDEEMPDTLKPAPAPPVVTQIVSVVPSTGDAAGGETVRINLTRVRSGATVTIGGAAATVTNGSYGIPGYVDVTTPAGDAGDADVVVTDYHGVATLEDGFEYEASGGGEVADVAIDFTGGSDGASISGFTGGTYSDDVTGPFSESLVARLSISAGGDDFGGGLPDNGVTLEPGDDIWIRSYHYFPTAFCAGYESGSDGWDHIKWLRVEWYSGGTFRRMTGQLGGFGSDSCNSSGPTHRGVTTESFPDGTENLWWGAGTTIPRDQWVAIQWHIHVDINGDGFIRGWLNSTYLGQVDATTYAGLGLTTVRFVYGDYWNGDAYQTTAWYVNDFIIMRETPSTTDSGGRPYIAPTTSIADVTE